MRRIFVLLVIISSMALVGRAASPATEESLPHNLVWGADIGGAIDMSGHDMSTIDIDAYFGYRGGIMSVLGIGAGINNPVNNSRREFPVYAIARTSFVKGMHPVFGELRAGVVFNTHPESDSSTDLYLSPGIGFRLATGRTFASYLIVGYIYNGLHSSAISDEPSIDSENNSVDNLSNRIRGVHSAVVRLGITF